MFTKRMFSLLIVALAAMSLQAHADPEEPMMGGGYGPGMMGGGYGPGYMGRGYGHGMMGEGYGMGMMGGYGHGMMGGGYGMGMMGGDCGGMGAMSRLDLTKEQRHKINAIRNDLRKQNWARMGKMMDAKAHMQELYEDDTPDPKAIGKAFAEISDIKRQMLEAHIAAHNQMKSVLTDDQRKELREMRHGGHGWMREQGGHMMMNR